MAGLPSSIPGLLAEGADFSGHGDEEQLAVERERFWQIGGNGTPVIRDPKSAQFWPQAYELLRSTLAVKSGQVPLAGPAIVRYELLRGLTAQPRYALLARGSSLILYDARARASQFTWTGQAPITGAGIVVQTGGELHLLVATSDSLLWRLDWNRGMAGPPEVAAQEFPDAVASIREIEAEPGAAIIAGARGIYLYRADRSAEKMVSGDFTSAWPLVSGSGRLQSIAAATRQGQVLGLEPVK